MRRDYQDYSRKPEQQWATQHQQQQQLARGGPRAGGGGGGGLSPGMALTLATALMAGVLVPAANAAPTGRTSTGSGGGGGGGG